MSKPSVGLSSLQQQYVRKAAKKGFFFTVMLAGESSLGKSTLIETLFMEAKPPQAPPPAAARITKTIAVTPRSMVIQDNGLQLKLNVIDTPGFADAVDNTQCWKPLVDYINTAYLNYLRDESKLDRKAINDERVHCLLYFISPTSRGLKPLDVETLKALHHKVNVVPVIAKADTLTKAELAALKDAIHKDIQKNNINIFKPAVDDEEDDGHQGYKLIETMPFALVGSNKTYQVAGRPIRGRMYPWGIVEVDNPDHCDFSLLRDMIVRTHLNDMKDYTVEVLYEEFRREHLREGGSRALEASSASIDSGKADPVEVQRQQALKGKELERKEAEIQAQLQELARTRQQLMGKAPRRSFPDGDTV